jgi:hypothetical protein
MPAIGLSVALMLASGARADLTGTRMTSGTVSPNTQLVWNPAAGGWDNGGFKIQWTISADPSKTAVVGGNTYQIYDYTYDVITPNNGSAASGNQLSHILLGLSTSVTVATASNDPELNNLFNMSYAAGTFDTPATSSGNSNDGLPSNFWSIKFTRSDANAFDNKITFESLHAPVWGNFYARDGGGSGSSTVYAYNKDFSTAPSNPNDVTNDAGYQGYILTPDTTTLVVSVPEPSTLAIAGVGALGFGAHAWRRRVRKGKKA